MLLLNAIPRLDLRNHALPPATLTCTRASDQMNGATSVVANEIWTNERALPDTCDRLGRAEETSRSVQVTKDVSLINWCTYTTLTTNPPRWCWTSTCEPEQNLCGECHYYIYLYIVQTHDWKKTAKIKFSCLQISNFDIKNNTGLFVTLIIQTQDPYLQTVIRHISDITFQNDT